MDKKKMFGLVGVLGALVMGYFLVGGKNSPPKIRLCTWSNYFSDELIADFTAKTGIAVEVSYISSNEELFAKLKAGASGYDLIQPSDYMVAQMVGLKMATPLRPELLENKKHLDSYYSNLPYDPGLKYSIPFVRGITGIIVNTAKVTLPTEAGWDLLFRSPDPKHTSMLDDMREVFGAVNMWKGRSINEVTDQTLAANRTDLERTKQEILLFSSEPLSFLLKEEVTIAHAFSVHGLEAQKQDPKFKFVIPKEGATIWTDNFVIPTTSSQVVEAHRFINHFMDPEVALKVIAFNHMASPNRTAWERLGEAEKNDPTAYPSPDVMKRLYFLEGHGPGFGQMSRFWTELKS